MSLYNVLRTGVSGMEAQSYKLATVADNIANANTVGYKRADTEFSSLILEAGNASYSSGAVEAKVTYEIGRQGGLSYTTSKTDVAVQGAGFFVVQDANGGNFLTRSGSFVIDGQSGNLVNAGGFALLGFPSVAGKEPSITLNDTAGLVPVDMDYMNMRATPSTDGVFRANLPSDATAVTGSVAGDNLLPSTATIKTSLVAYDDLGAAKTLDVYWTKIRDYDATATGSARQPQWEIVVYDQASRNPAADTDFPYGTPPTSPATNPPLGGATPANPKLAQAIVTFDPALGGVVTHIEDVLAGGATWAGTPNVDLLDASQKALLSIALPDASDPLTLDITGTTQLAAAYQPLEAAVNGNKPAAVEGVKISADGRIFAQYGEGREVEFYRLPLANVPAPDQLGPEPGNVYRVTVESGDLRIGLPNQAGNGKLVIGAVEESNVDLASELTDMIIAQRAYTANSKSFQTGNELLEVLMGLKR